MDERLRLLVRPPEELATWQWAEKYFRLPITAEGVPFDTEDSPWLRQILDAFDDVEVREIVVQTAAQSGKTVTGFVIMCRSIADDLGGSMMWLTFNKEEATKLAKGRIHPTLNLCKPVAEKMPKIRGMKNTREIYFPDGMFYIGSADTASDTESTPYRRIILDEEHHYKEEVVPKAEKRTRSFKGVYKIIRLSTAGVAGDHLDRGYKQGDQAVAHVTCPCCGTTQPIEWGERDKPGGMKFDLNEETAPDGQYRLDLIYPTIRYECCGCDHRWTNSESDRKSLSKATRFVAQNQNAPKALRSFHWNAILPWWADWRDLVKEFLQAVAAMEMGEFEPYRIFWTRTLGLPWEDRLKERKDEGFIDEREDVYDPREPWPAFQAAMKNWMTNPMLYPKPRRFMGVDVQAKGGRHFYYEIRDVIPGGGSRLVAWGKAWSAAELRGIASLWEVPPSQVGIDARFEPDEVAGYIIESGLMPDRFYNWKMMMGDKGEYFHDEDGVRVPYQISFYEPFVGKANHVPGNPIKLYLFKKVRMLERQELLMRGMSAPWLIPAPRTKENPHGADPYALHEYKLQVTAYRREDKQDRFGSNVRNWYQIRTDDHWGSTTRMIIALSMIAGLMQPPNLGGEQPKEEPGP